MLCPITNVQTKRNFTLMIRVPTKFSFKSTKVHGLSSLIRSYLTHALGVSGQRAPPPYWAALHGKPEGPFVGRQLVSMPLLNPTHPCLSSKRVMGKRKTGEWLYS